MSLFTPEQLQELNSIVTSRLDSVKSSVDSIKTLIERQSLEMQAAKQPAKEEKSEDLSIRTRLQQLEERNRQLEDQERQSKITSIAVQGLKSRGITNNSELAMAYLKEGLHYDKLTGQPYLTLNGIPRPLEDALDIFASSKHAEVLRDPVPANGAGQKSFNNTASTSPTNPVTSRTVQEKLSHEISGKNFLNREEMAAHIKNSLGSDLKM